MTFASVMNDKPIPSVTSSAMNKILHEMATLRARSSGSDVILPRHITEAAQALKNPSTTGTLMSPAATLPEHYDFLCTELNKISDMISNDKILSRMPPKVLVIGEVSGAFSSMFRMAGAHVAMCDWKLSRSTTYRTFRETAKTSKTWGGTLLSHIRLARTFPPSDRSGYRSSLIVNKLFALRLACSSPCLTRRLRSLQLRIRGCIRWLSF
jgi:hypothetical protein